jgi:hypothetical protein
MKFDQVRRFLACVNPAKDFVNEMPTISNPDYFTRHYLQVIYTFFMGAEMTISLTK